MCKPTLRMLGVDETLRQRDMASVDLHHPRSIALSRSRKFRYPCSTPSSRWAMPPKCGQGRARRSGLNDDPLSDVAERERHDLCQAFEWSQPPRWSALTRYSVSRILVTVRNSVREVRTAADLSQGSLADAVGVSRQTINSIETGKYSPSLPLALALARYFDTTVEALFDADHEIPTKRGS